MPLHPTFYRAYGTGSSKWTFPHDYTGLSMDNFAFRQNSMGLTRPH